jgi:hypothetical protein
VSDDDPYDLKRLRIDPTTFSTPPVPAKIRKRQEQFVLVPMWWYQTLLKDPAASGTTCLVALYLLHLNWKNYGKPFKLPNGMLEYDGISRYSKWRALSDLGRRGLIAVEHRPKKSPLVHVRLQPA